MLRKTITNGPTGSAYDTMNLFTVTGAVLIRLCGWCKRAEGNRGESATLGVSPFSVSMDVEEMTGGSWFNTEFTAAGSHMNPLVGGDFSRPFSFPSIALVQSSKTDWPDFTFEFYIFWTPLSADGLVEVATGGSDGGGGF